MALRWNNCNVNKKVTAVKPFESTKERCEIADESRVENEIT